ncbi:MAG: DNA/RNA non-specific endonuclease [Alkalinema sp. RU_4_3]|nr:DNA/RNA non-specific endonuclease [Alkalinema sp. RU_4_3]
MNFKALFKTTLLTTIVLVGLSQAALQARRPRLTLAVTAPGMPAAIAPNPNLLLGNPSQATAIDRNNLLVARPQYVLSYNADRGIPNWTSWQLNASWLGNLPRRLFMPDTTLGAGIPVVTQNDYNGSGFDRGHMVPAADRNRTPEDSQSVFLMSNILPQAPDNNQGPWEKLESYSRDLVRQGKELYIIAGGTGDGGIGKNGPATTIARGKVAVPKMTWKVIVVLDGPSATPAITSKTRVIAVSMPNEQGIKDMPWQNYRVSVDAIEAITGYDLLSTVPKRTQTALEKRVDSL